MKTCTFFCDLFVIYAGGIQELQLPLEIIVVSIDVIDFFFAAVSTIRLERVSNSHVLGGTS